MSLELIVMIVSGVLVPVVGAIMAIGKAAQMLRDHERRINRLEADDDAEDAGRLLGGCP